MPFARHQLRAGREIKRALRADRVLRGVAIAHVLGIVEERVGRLIALEIDDAKRLPAFDFVHPAIARREREIIARIRGIEGAFGVNQGAHAPAK